MDEQQQAIFDKAKSALLSTPGHAEWLRAQALVNAKKSLHPVR